MDTSPVAAHLGAAARAALPAAWRDGWRPERFALDGGFTEVVTMGAGPTLVLLPPLPGYKEAWIRCAPLLARRFRVVTFDLRVRFAGRPAWPALLADLERALDAHAPGAVFVAGHSMGGALAQHWALAQPERVRALVLSSTFARVTHPKGNRWARFVEQPLVVASQRLLPAPRALALARRLAARYAWVYDPRCDDDVLGFVRHCMRATPWSHARACLDLLFVHDTRAGLRGLAPPALVVVGERESVFSHGAAEELRRGIPGAEYAVSPGVSHLHPLSSPEWLAERIEEWMTRHERREADDVEARA